MADAYVVAAVRTPVGRRNGGLSEVHAVDLAAHSLRAVVERAGVDPIEVGDVIMGCVNQVGPQGSNIGRLAALAAGFPESVPGTTVHRQCGSSQQAVAFAAQGVLSGVHDLVIGCGVEVMSMVPLIANQSLAIEAGLPGAMDSPTFRDRYSGVEISQFRGAELIAEKWDISRLEMEELALRSHQLAEAAWQRGDYDDEVVPFGDVSRDEGIRPDTTLEKMATLKTLSEGGRLTAAVSSQISDASAAMLIASGEAVERLGLTPLARIHTLVVAGSDPIFVLTGPIPATQLLLERTGLSIDDIDVFEVNEAFSSVVLAWQKELGAPLDKVNVNGGAISMGHPLGATGARLGTTLVHHMRKTGKKLGLQVMCEGGGMANATLFESVGD